MPDSFPVYDGHQPLTVSALNDLIKNIFRRKYITGVAPIEVAHSSSGIVFHLSEEDNASSVGPIGASGTATSNFIMLPVEITGYTEVNDLTPINPDKVGKIRQYTWQELGVVSVTDPQTKDIITYAMQLKTGGRTGSKAWELNKYIVEIGAHVWLFNAGGVFVFDRCFDLMTPYQAAKAVQNLARSMWPAASNMTPNTVVQCFAFDSSVSVLDGAFHQFGQDFNPAVVTIGCCVNRSQGQFQSQSGMPMSFLKGVEYLGPSYVDGDQDCSNQIFRNAQLTLGPAPEGIWIGSSPICGPQQWLIGFMDTEIDFGDGTTSDPCYPNTGSIWIVYCQDMDVERPGFNPGRSSPAYSPSLTLINNIYAKDANTPITSDTAFTTFLGYLFQTNQTSTIGAGIWVDCHTVGDFYATCGAPFFWTNGPDSGNPCGFSVNTNLYELTETA